MTETIFPSSFVLSILYALSDTHLFHLKPSLSLERFYCIKVPQVKNLEENEYLVKKKKRKNNQDFRAFIFSFVIV